MHMFTDLVTGHFTKKQVSDVRNFGFRASKTRQVASGEAGPSMARFSKYASKTPLTRGEQQHAVHNEWDRSDFDLHHGARLGSGVVLQVTRM